jgi:hypothetical protein
MPWIIATLIGFVILASQAHAGVLSPFALYNRCYSQLTQLRAPQDDARANAVKAGTKDPIVACLEVLDSARLSLNSNTQIGNTGDAQAKAVLRTLHNVHAGWFSERDFPFIDADDRLHGNMDLYDGSSPALYYTKALFDSTTRFDSIVLSSANLRAVRTDSDPTNGARTNKTKAEYIFSSATPFAPRGELLGVTATGPQTLSYSYTQNGSTVSGSLNLGGTIGGGILGTPSYLLLNIGPFRNANGTNSMPRKWARGVFNDLLCRELPVVRTRDASLYVSTSSTVEFRQVAACVRCHVSMDRMSANARNFRYQNLGNDTVRGGNFASWEPVTVSAETEWPTTADSNYFKRPPNGNLYFRNYMGNLVDLTTSSVADLGTKLAAQDDLYICAAKRYYEYFTGIKVNTGDVFDPDDPTFLSEGDKAHRDSVVKLGQALRSHQSARRLIEEILKKPEYRSSDYGIKGVSP